MPNTKPTEELPPITVEASEILDKVDNLPTLPIVALRVGELVHDPGVSARQISEVMRDDPSLSAKVLKMVNSPYYGIPGGVSDVARAISFVGFNTLHQLVLSVSVLDTLTTPRGSSFDARGLWLHSLAVGACAQVLATEIRHPDPGACFTAGLLHDVGKIALAKAAPELFGIALDDAQKRNCSMSEAERRAGLPSHDKVGSKLARKWKFPQALLLPIELHHSGDSPSIRKQIAPNLMASVDIVALADQLARRYNLGESGSPALTETDATALDRLGLSEGRLSQIHLKLMKQLEVSKVFLDLIDQKPEAQKAESGARGIDTRRAAPPSGNRR